MTRWQMQTQDGGPDLPPEQRGDCYRACVASILNVPIDSLPNAHGDDADDVWFRALAKLGYCRVDFNVFEQVPPSYWIATVPSTMLGIYHAVVAKGNDLIHDPSRGRRYTDAEWREARAARCGEVLLPLDPAATKPEESEGNG